MKNLKREQACFNLPTWPIRKFCLNIHLQNKILIHTIGKVSLGPLNGVMLQEGFLKRLDFHCMTPNRQALQCFSWWNKSCHLGKISRVFLNFQVWLFCLVTNVDLPLSRSVAGFVMETSRDSSEVRGPTKESFPLLVSSGFVQLAHPLRRPAAV